MLDSGGGGGSYAATTDFEAHTHQELRNMIEAANPDTLKSHAELLAEAAQAIDTIGQDLKTYITSVDWRGEAGEAFEAWGDQTWKATLLLADYTDVGATWMGDAAQTLREVKSALPPVDASAQGNLEAAREFHNDPDSQMIASQARAKLNEDHAEAVQQMTKLAQSYSLSSSVIGAQDPPVFPPPPQAFVPDGGRDNFTGDAAWSSNSSAGGGGSSDGYRASLSQTSADTRNVPPVTGLPTQIQTTPPSVERPVAMEIDSVATLPPPTQVPPAGPPNVVPPAGRPDGGMPPVGLIPPAFGGNPGSQPGGGRVGGVRPPSLSGQPPLAGSSGGRMPRDTGIVGGRPVPPQASGRPSGGIPRGTVVGGEAMHGRPPMGGATGGGAMGGGAGASGGTAGGRRLAGETGGMMAGRPQQAGTTGARPFTPGGSGLVRGAGTDGGNRPGQTGRPGVAPHSSQRPGRRPEDEDGQRPDYLTEDEETWQQGGRRIVPPVID